MYFDIFRGSKLRFVCRLGSGTRIHSQLLRPCCHLGSTTFSTRKILMHIFLNVYSIYIKLNTIFTISHKNMLVLCVLHLCLHHLVSSLHRPSFDSLDPFEVFETCWHASTWRLWCSKFTARPTEVMQYAKVNEKPSCQLTWKLQSNSATIGCQQIRFDMRSSCDFWPENMFKKTRFVFVNFSSFLRFSLTDLRSCKNQAATKDIGSAESSPWRKQDQLRRHRRLTLNLEV